jgi:hypothetical protein
MFCVYLTIYSGNQLPPFYIGSSSAERILSGYHGSVTSKRFGAIWKRELRSSPQLFKTKIISEHPSRKEAFERECDLQQKLNVIKSPLYINLSFAKPNGFFGNGVCGEDHPTHSKNYRASVETRSKISLNSRGEGNGMFNKNHTLEARIKMSSSKGQRSKDPIAFGNYSKAKAGKAHPNFGKKQKTHVIEALRQASLGKPKSEEHRRKLAESKIGKKLFNNGIVSRMFNEPPDNTWVRGQLGSS